MGWCLVTASKSGRVDANTPAVTLNQNVYYCDSGAAASKWGWYPANYTGFDKWVQGTGNDGQSRFSDPRFIDPTTADFHLKSDSAAVHAGSYAK